MAEMTEEYIREHLKEEDKLTYAFMRVCEKKAKEFIDDLEDASIYVNEERGDNNG